jgi:hypothetical protein
MVKSVAIVYPEIDADRLVEAVLADIKAVFKAKTAAERESRKRG